MYDYRGSNGGGEGGLSHPMGSNLQVATLHVRVNPHAYQWISTGSLLGMLLGTATYYQFGFNPYASVYSIAISSIAHK